APGETTQDHHGQSLFGRSTLAKSQRRGQHAEARGDGCEHDRAKAHLYGVAHGFLDRHSFRFVLLRPVEQNDTVTQPNADQRKESDDAGGIEPYAAQNECNSAARNGERNLEQQDSRNEEPVELQDEDAYHEEEGRKHGDRESESGPLEV